MSRPASQSGASRVWIDVEAKTAQTPDGVTSIENVRQANTQLRLYASDLGTTAAGPNRWRHRFSARHVRSRGDRCGGPHVYLAHPDAVGALDADAREAWVQLMARKAGHDGDDLHALVRRIFGDRRCLPSQVLERLTVESVAG